MMIEDEYINSKYNQIKFLGEGGFGKVILAKDKNTNSKVAIKYIDFEEMNQDAIEKVIQEGHLLFKIKHKNIIKFKDFFYNESRAILIMEFAEGGDLNKRINKQRKIGPFNEELIITWFLELCNVIKFCHERNIIHRDLKPQNIFLTKDNHIKLGDFGISKVLKFLGDKANTQIGTLLYMSPEVLTGKKYSYSCDIWSLGIILYELCLLKHPLSHINKKQILQLLIEEGDFETIYKNNKINYSEKTFNLIKKILVKNPEERPTINEIIKESEDIINKLKYIKIKPHYNNEEKPFHIINGKMIYDSLKIKINQNKEKISQNNFPDRLNKKNNEKINNLKLIPENVDEACEDELKKTITRINQEGFKMMKKEKEKKMSLSELNIIYYL